MNEPCSDQEMNDLLAAYRESRGHDTEETKLNAVLEAVAEGIRVDTGVDNDEWEKGYRACADRVRRLVEAITKQPLPTPKEEE